ncbi:MAG: hypothetical protein R3336_10080, partial [Phycisphaeraceae bacterium]|nr:hypothetical protein [Phycisphaeraceae bacterium]
MNRLFEAFRNQLDQLPGWIATGYLAFGLFWIVVSDQVLGFWIENPGTITWVQTLKGVSFVIASGLFIYLTVRHAIGMIMEHERELARSDTDLSAIIEATPLALVMLDQQGN